MRTFRCLYCGCEILGAREDHESECPRNPDVKIKDYSMTEGEKQ